MPVPCPRGTVTGLLLHLLQALVLVAGALVAFIIVAGWLVSTPPYRGPRSDHFDGRRFRNASETPHNEFRDAAQWAMTRQPGPWAPPRDVPPGPAPEPRVVGDRLRVTFINHTTVLLQTQGLNILTDPIWSTACGPGGVIGPRRVRPPGIGFDDLPAIDIVLLSHNHYDHLDPRTMRRLWRRDQPRIVVPLGVARYLGRRGVRTAGELDWWQSVAVADGISITGVPARHFSGRGIFDRDRSLWTGYAVTTPAGWIYFAGDTGFGEHFAEVRRRLGAPRLSLLPIGAFRPEWFMSRVHISPDQAIEAHTILESSVSVATHFGTFRLADDGETEPTERLAAALHEGRADPNAFWLLGFGEGRDVPLQGFR